MDSEQVDAMAMVQAQFHAQRATLGALQQGRLPPESTLLAACGGRVPVTAVTELAQAAAAHRQRRAAHVPADGSEGQRLQQGAADASGGPADGVEEEGSDSQRLQAAIREKLRHLAPQKRKVQHDVLLERSLKQCSQHQLLDWRRMRRPLPGSNQYAFEPPLQPMALLTQQAAQRAQRAAVAARAEKLREQRAYLELKQREEQQREQQQQQQQQHEADAAQKAQQRQAELKPFRCDAAASSDAKPRQEQEQQQADEDCRALRPPPPPETLAQLAQLN
ncbi:hypothetical protein D9Q98_004599 [Chlorella vulgaris]|uniref:Uncharacterized protein n=1 Tax=Chlorella vulgaris TaxID=3077 RepID=A0A9D4YXN4_CHLVU|nr:hypothetical protein D9Q98_004599 [Chlorella vulgaris]